MIFVLEINAPRGNIFLDKSIEKIIDFEKLKLSRMELEKRILRVTGSHGTDIGLRLDEGVKLRHGDIIGNNDTKIIIEQIPEKVITVKLDSKNIPVLVLLGHIIGNRHRPISIKDEEISFPIQADSEKEIFTKLFQSIINFIEIKVTEQIFLPHTGANIHEH